MTSSGADAGDSSRLDAYIMFVGASGVGKSCYTHYLELNRPPSGDDAMPEPTVGMQFRFFSRTSAKNARFAAVRFVLIDTGGQDNFRHALPTMYRRAEVVVFVYDLTDRDSFLALRQRFWPEASEHARNMRLCVVIGNKSDLAAVEPGRRAVTREEGESFAKEIGALDFFERSALTDAQNEIFWPIDKCALRLAEIGPAEKYRRAPPSAPIRLRAKNNAAADNKNKTGAGCCS
jgi:small GTP-binding protein